MTDEQSKKLTARSVMQSS